jgi:hypothetical protein
LRGNAKLGPPYQVAFELTAAGDVTVEGDGYIFAKGRGYPVCSGPGAGVCDGTTSRVGGGGYGGAGGDGQYRAGGGTYGSLWEPSHLGSGGGYISGYGGRGGGAVRLDVGGALHVDGTITVNGDNSTTYGHSGGSGGSIWLTCDSFAGAGVISASGGAVGSSANQSGGGGGGRIAVYCGSSTYTGSITAYGGSGSDPYEPGGAGTVYIDNSQEILPRLIIDNGGTSGEVTEVNTPLAVDADVVVRGNAKLGPPYQVAFQLTAAGDVTVEGDGYVYAKGRGYPACDGPGQGECGGQHAGGGGYGGAGGDGATFDGGSTYGSEWSPTHFGSGGGGVVGWGGNGGGAIQIDVVGALHVDGTITANGASAANGQHGGGSGEVFG